jgi:hypothetical protein
MRPPMQALVVILDDQLPVRLHVVDDAAPEAQVLHSPRTEAIDQGTELFRQRRSGLGQIQEHMAVPLVGTYCVEREVALPEVRDFVHVRRADQASVEVVGPRVIRALDAARKLSGLLRAQPRPAMTAHVMEGGHTTRGVARDHDVVAVQLANDELSRTLDLLGTGGIEPHTAE